MARQRDLEYPASLYRGAPPHAPGVETSRAAAEAIAPKANQIREAVLAIIRESGPYGMTIDEIAVRRGMTPNAVSPRVRELALLGAIKDGFTRRPTRARRPAIVWVLA